jgi:hypothetical protein
MHDIEFVPIPRKVEVIEIEKEVPASPSRLVYSLYLLAFLVGILLGFIVNGLFH